MPRNVTLLLLLTVFSVLMFAGTWEGSLIDATCYSHQKRVNACYPTNTTVAYAVVVERRIYRLEEAGNVKVAKALKDRADRSANPDPTPNTRMSATITGALDSSGFLRVDAVSIR